MVRKPGIALVHKVRKRRKDGGVSCSDLSTSCSNSSLNTAPSDVTLNHFREYFLTEFWEESRLICIAKDRLELNPVPWVNSVLIAKLW